MSKLYGGRWQRARKLYLTMHPRCRMCSEVGKLSPARVVDHIVPHRGDIDLFWDQEGNWQPLCTHHHNVVKQSHEKRGGVLGYDGDGRPLDPTHPWNKTVIVGMGEG